MCPSLVVVLVTKCYAAGKWSGDMVLRAEIMRINYLSTTCSNSWPQTNLLQIRVLFKMALARKDEGEIMNHVVVVCSTGV